MPETSLMGLHGLLELPALSFDRVAFRAADVAVQPDIRGGLVECQISGF